MKGPTSVPKKSETDVKPTGVDQFDMRLVKALRHPTRGHALTVLTDRIASPKEIADELGIDVSLASYHFKRLVELRCIELVKVKKIRNADQHFYRATVQHFFSPEEWKKVPTHDRLKLRIDLVKLISGEASIAAAAKTLDTVDNHMTRTAMRLDKQGWAELSAQFDVQLEKVLMIKEAAALRLGESDEAPIDARVALLQFAMPAD